MRRRPYASCEEIPLADVELAAVEDRLTAYQQLLARLADVPTPSPNCLRMGNFDTTPFGADLCDNRVSAQIPQRFGLHHLPAHRE